MKTSLVVKTYRPLHPFSRASLPTDHADWLNFVGNANVPVYVAAYTANGRNQKGQSQWREPEAVFSSSHVFHPKRGKIDEIRCMDDEFVNRLSEIDAEREQLRSRLKQLEGNVQDILEYAYMRGKPIALDEVKAWVNERRIAREAKAAAQAVTITNK